MSEGKLAKPRYSVSRKGMGGRPSKYSLAKAKLICSAVAAGQTLAQIAEALEIHLSILHDWRNAHPEFAAMLAEAREVCAEHFADEIVRIADDSSADFVEFETPSGRIRREPNHELVQRSRLRVDTRWRLMQKWAP